MGNLHELLDSGHAKLSIIVVMNLENVDNTY